MTPLYKVNSGGRWFLEILRNKKGGSAKYLFFITRVGGWSEKGQKHPYVISEQSLYKNILDKSRNLYLQMRRIEITHL